MLTTKFYLNKQLESYCLFFATSVKTVIDMKFIMLSSQTDILLFPDERSDQPYSDPGKLVSIIYKMH